MAPLLDPNSLLALSTIGALAKPWLAERVKERLERADRQFLAERDEALWCIATEAAKASTIEDKIEALQTNARISSDEKDAQIAAITVSLAELDRRLNDRQLTAIVRNYQIEARREALVERYGLIVAAAAETILSDLAVEHKARVERTIRELDPNDILELDFLTQVTAPTRPRTMFTAGMRRRQEWESSPSRDELFAASVIRLRTDAGEVECTSRGMHVLAILQRWTAQHRPVRPHEERIDVGYDVEAVRDARALLLLRAHEIGNRHHAAAEFDATTQDDAHFEAAKLLKKESLIEWTQGRNYRLTERALATARDRDRLGLLLPTSYGASVD